MRKISKILIIRFSSMGDVVLASPLIRILRKKFPAVQMDFVTKEQYSELVRYNPHLSNIITIKAEAKNELKILGKTLQEMKYDIVLDLHNSLRSRYLRTFLKGSEIHIVNKRVFARFLLVRLKKNIYKGIIPVAQRYIETAASLDVRDDGLGLELFVNDSAQTSVAKALNDFLVPGTCIIGISPTAKHFTKMWPADRFIDYGGAAAEKYKAKILLFGGPDDTEYCDDIATRINARAGKGAARNCAGKFTMLETAAAIDRCTFVVTNDTGIMHIASARGKRLVAIFGSTVEQFGFFPDRQLAEIVEKRSVRCRPCSHIGRDECPRGHFNCMNEISVEDVLRATEKRIPVPA